MHDLNSLVVPRAAEDVRILGLDGGRWAFRRTLADPGLAGALGELFGVQFASVERGRRQLIVPGPEGPA